MAIQEIDIAYVVGGAAATRIESFADSPGGPLKATSENLCCNLIGGCASGDVQLSRRILELVNPGPMLVASDLAVATNPWHILPSRWQQLAAAWVAKGMPTR